MGRMAELTAEAMPRLRSMKDLTEYWIEINRLENQADQLYRRLLAKLFSGESDAIHVLKMKDIVTRSRRRPTRSRGRQHGRVHRGQGELTTVDSLALSPSSSPWRWSSTTPTGSTTRRTPSRPRCRPGRSPPDRPGSWRRSLNFVGAFFGTKVAQTVGSGIIDAPEGIDGLVIVAPALGRRHRLEPADLVVRPALVLVQALIGGLVGAALAAGATVHWQGVLDKVVIPMLLSPVAGFILGYLVMTAILWIFRGANPGKMTGASATRRRVSAAAMAFGHGLQDAQKTTGVVFLALNVGGVPRRDRRSRSGCIVLSAVVI